MLSERRRLSDVATCCSASGDAMHYAGTAGHSTHERALDTVRHATGDPVSAMVNASISQVVLLYSVQPLSFSKTAAAKRELGRNEGTASVYATSACPQPREPRAPPAPRSHTRQLNPASHIAQHTRQLNPASHIAPPSRPSRQNPRTNVHFSLFLTKSCRLCAGFDVGIAYHSNAGAQPPESAIQFVAQQNPPLTFKVATIATSTPREENL